MACVPLGCGATRLVFGGDECRVATANDDASIWGVFVLVEGMVAADDKSFRRKGVFV